MLHAPDGISERLLAIGHQGAGKSTGWLQIARFSLKTKSPARFYVVDTDFAIRHMLVGGYPELMEENGGNVVLREVYDWPQYMAGSKDIMHKVQPGDWIVIDMAGPAWSAVQDYFTNEVFHKDMGAYFLEVRKALKDGKRNLAAFEGFTDWVVVNALYGSWIQPLLFKSPAHVYTCAQITAINAEKEDKGTKVLFGHFGVKPVGQKSLPYQHHTILIMSKGGQDQYLLTSVKDRERQLLEGKQINNLVTGYLLPIAGWRL